MPKALKISGFEITEVEVLNGCGFIQDPRGARSPASCPTRATLGHSPSGDPDYQDRTRPFDSHALTRPETWDGAKFNLAFVCWDQFFERDFREGDNLNILGTYIYRMLKHNNAILDDGIPGPVYLINEDKDGIIDLTKDDLKYIVQRSRHFEDLTNNEDHLLMLKLLGAILIKFPELR